MSSQPRFDQLLPFTARTTPDARLLGPALQGDAVGTRVHLQLRFGQQVAGFPVQDIWSACCELLLSAQLVRRRVLHHFTLDVEQLFDVECAGDTLLCILSPEHVFAVALEEFAGSLERLVSEIFSGTKYPEVTRIAAEWGASEIRGRAYAARFSDALLF